VVSQVVPKSKWPKPVIDQRKCTACSCCVDVCNRSSLSIALPASLSNLRVFVELSNPDSCVGCGLCERVCPVGAIVLQEAK
jgi:NAD-dependent dihydropyrimidine dehydrogenase PreA subunit